MYIKKKKSYEKMYAKCFWYKLNKLLNKIIIFFLRAWVLSFISILSQLIFIKKMALLYFLSDYRLDKIVYLGFFK
jgi:hypothetical protein